MVLAKELVQRIGQPKLPVKFKALLQKFLPQWVVLWRVRHGVRRTRARNHRLTRQDVFDAVYERNAWGGEKGNFFSGRGSDATAASEYCETVKHFIVSHGIKTVLDVGCGDFRVGRELQMTGVTYIGIDIVRSLIERNTSLFATDTISFRCLDAVQDELPDADLVLVRQVFQHLSNDEIATILRRLTKFRYIIVTEHRPSSLRLRTPNLDKAHGGDTRLIDDSGVYLEHAPFFVSEAEVLVETRLSPPIFHEGETLTSLLIIQSK